MRNSPSVSTDDAASGSPVCADDEVAVDGGPAVSFSAWSGLVGLFVRLLFLKHIIIRVFVRVVRSGWAVCSSAVMKHIIIRVFVRVVRSGWAVFSSAVSETYNYPCVCENGQVWLGCLFVCCL